MYIKKILIGIVIIGLAVAAYIAYEWLGVESTFGLLGAFAIGFLLSLIALLVDNDAYD